jgi:hypothetical protein
MDRLSDDRYTTARVPGGDRLPESMPRWTSAGAREGVRREDTHMLMTIALILLALWLLGMVTSYTRGGIIHVILVIPVVVFLVRVIQGRRVV